MSRFNHAILAPALVVTIFGGVSAVFAQAAPAAQTPPPSRAVWVDTMRGTADILFITPNKGNGLIKLEKDGTIVTTMKVKNVSPKAIARLTVEEFWYDNKGNPVSGDKVFLKKPLMAGEEAVMVLHTPKSPLMNSNKYKFSHANGDVKPRAVSKF